ncbi:glycosyltransferase family 39 protein [bacterium]|nr:glycosyltransferase family 39 protein [bacterium]
MNALRKHYALRDPWFWLIFGAGILLRVWHLLHAMQSPTFWAPAVDPLWYHEAALRASEGDLGPWPLFRAPLYPLLLGLVYRLFEHDLLWARILNLVLQAATIWAIYGMAREFFGRRSALVAAALFAINGLAIFYSAEILSTSLEMLAAVLAAWSTLSLIQEANWKSSLSCGLTWGVTAIIRPNFLLVAPVVLIVVLWPLLRAKRLIPIAAVWIGLFLPILPVTAANWLIGGEPVLIATQGGINFWIGNNPRTDAISSVLPGRDRFWTLEEARADARREAGQPMSDGEISDFYYDKGRDFLSSSPGSAVRLMLRKTALFFNRFEISNNKHLNYFAGQTPLLPALMLLNFGLLLPLAGLGLWLRRRLPEARLLIWMIGAYAFSVILFFIASRFRMPAVPWLCVLAGIGATALPEIKLSKEKPIAALLVLALVIVAWMNPWNAREASLGSARYMEGNAYLALDKLESARVCFQEAQLDPDTRELALLNLGVTESRAKNFAAAVSALQKLVAEFPTSAKGWNNLGTVQEELSDTNAAARSYQVAIPLDAKFLDPLMNLARLHLEIGKRLLRQGFTEESIPHFNHSIQLHPTASVHYHRAVALGQLGDETGAREELLRSLELDPAYSPALTLMNQLRQSQSASTTPVPAPK